MLDKIGCTTEDGIYYEIHPQIKDIRLFQLELAEEVKRICDKYKIKYFIIWGTLLGAVRNRGYIPWDDDFDIALLRKDYNKFLKVAKLEIRAPLFLQTALSDRQYFFPYARLRNSETTGIIVDNFSSEYNNGIFIDIYPLDAIPTNAFLKEVKFELRDWAYYICTRYYQKSDNSVLDKILASLFSYESICGVFDRICMIGNKIDSQIVGLAYSKHLSKTYRFHKRNVKDLCVLPFEGHWFFAPREYKEILKEVYGDYMRIPPKRKRGKWHDGQIIYEPNISYKQFIKGIRDDEKV